MEKLKKYFLENPFIIFLPFMCLVLPFILFDEVGYQCVISLVWTLVGFVGIFTYKISEDIKTHLFMSFVIFLLGFVGGQDIRSTEKTTTEFTEDYTIEETEYFLIFRRDKYITCVIRRDSTLKYDTDNPLVIYEVYKIDRFGTSTWPKLVAKSNLMSESVNILRLDRVLGQEYDL